MSTQTHTLHRALLRPFLLHTLRAAGFHSTKPSVLDTLVNLTERYLMLLASTTASHARNAHNDALPTLSDVRAALQDCGALAPLDGAAVEEWRETLRVPLVEVGEAVFERGGAGNGSDGDRGVAGARAREVAEKRKRDEEDVGDVRGFARWFDGSAYAEIRRVAGLTAAGDGLGAGAAGSGGGAAGTTGGAGAGAVGVGGGVVHAEDFLTGLKKRSVKGGAGDEAKWVGTVLGRPAEERSVLLEGGPVQRIADWRPPLERTLVRDPEGHARGDDGKSDDSTMSSGLSSPTLVRDDVEPEVAMA